MITSVPEHTKVTEVLSPDKSGVVLFEYNSLVNASSHPHKFVYDYANGDLEGLREALSAISLSSIVGHNNIDDDWRCWKDLASSKRLKGRNPFPWIDSNILNLIKKKNSVRQKLKSHPNARLRDKFKSLRAQVKKLLRESVITFTTPLTLALDSIPSAFGQFET